VTQSSPSPSAAGAAGDVPVRDAATVVLLRDGAAEIEVWLLTRVGGMAFAGGMSVFPGGRVEGADAELPIVGSSLAEAAARFGTNDRSVRGFVGAAARELFEETGILLGAPPAVLADAETARRDVEAGQLDFAELLRSVGVAIDADAFHPWARWITPAGEVARRYDTRFFLAALPEGLDARHVTPEASAAAWVGVRAALEAGERGTRGLMPPTAATLAALAGLGSVREAIAAAGQRDLAPVSPTLHVTDVGVVAALPDGTTFVLPRTGRR
jgi:8-oxo-dGTP pyrophosphatase MutT (NUDIX family)